MNDILETLENMTIDELYVWYYQTMKGTAEKSTGFSSKKTPHNARIEEDGKDEDDIEIVKVPVTVKTALMPVKMVSLLVLASST